MDIFDSKVPELAKQENKVPTLSDHKAFNKHYVTRILATTVKCGHKVDPEIGPSNNCEYCWFAYFNSNTERVQKWCDELVKNNGSELSAFYGEKYVKWFRRFLIAVNQLKENNGKK